MTSVRVSFRFGSNYFYTMAASLRGMTFALLLLFASQQAIYGLKCYVCSNCPDPTNLVTIQSCASGCSCTKITTLSRGKVILVGRGSSPTDSCAEYNLVVDGTGYFQNCCTDDACNTGVVLSSSFGLFLVFTIILWIITY
ncbi:hypothetical protein I4U23_004204 [Adineta vaga]|nr:hypothetical protein I4U23_004204 [Adineta vaga]